MVSLKNILSRILQAHGFEAYEREGVMFGQRGDETISVGLFDDLTVSELKAHHRKVSGTASRNIVCVLEAGSSVEQEANALGLVLWRKRDIEEELGAAIDVHILRLGKSAFGTLLGVSAATSNGGPLVTVDSLGKEGPIRAMKCTLSIEDVREISKKTIQGFKFDLELVPHYIFEYSCSYEGPGGKDVSRTGLISVNALTGRCTTWDRMPETEDISADLVRMEPKLDEEHARGIATKAIIALNTEFRELIVERDHATIIEKSTFGPAEESILAMTSTFVMVPVWCVEGSHGVMILDGMSGKIISEDYYDKR